MNLKTFIILFIIGLLVSCSTSYDKNYSEDEDAVHHRYPETGSFR